MQSSIGQVKMSACILFKKHICMLNFTVLEFNILKIMLCESLSEST